MDELLAKAAENMKMPETMVRRSAEARAKAEGRSIEEVLAEWAGVEAPSSEAAAPEAETEPPAEEAPAEEAPAEEAPAEEAPAEKAAATGIDRFVEAAAEKMRMPASMIRRSAEARAGAEDRSYEEVLAEWAGADVAEVRAAAEESKAAEVEAEAPAETEEAPAEEPEGETPAEEGEREEAPTEEPAVPAEESEVDVEVVGGEEEAEEEPEGEEAEEEPEPVGVGRGLPRWLVTLFVIVPAFAIGYAAFFPNGPNCGDAGRLAVDPVTGLAVNCDGTAYGERVTDFLAIGADNYAVCAGCHGAGGSGSGAGPAFTGGSLLATFPEGQCEMQVEWVSIGTNAWPESTYGANDKPVGGFGVMPGFGNILSDDELRAVVLYERVQFGGEALDDAIADCGLGEGDDAEAPEPGAPGNGEDEAGGDE